MRPEFKTRLFYWLRLLVGTIVATYLIIIVISALAIMLMFTIPLRGNVCCLAIPHEEISFQTADGLKLFGWYVPPKNGAVIIVLHSYYGDRRQPLPVAEMLARHGYGVLMYDQRASGESEGQVRSLGRLDIPDVSEAVRFAQTRPGVDKSRIGVYGCSIGGAIAVAAAAADPSITAVAADAPSPVTFGESHPNIGEPGWEVNLPIHVFYHSFLALRTWALPPTSTREAVQAITPRPLLLLSTGDATERAYIGGLYDLAREPKQHANIPQASHCAGPVISPGEYEQHLIDFFDTSLPDS